MEVLAIEKAVAAAEVVANHYLHRKPPISFSFGLFSDGLLVGVCTFGVPPSRHLQKSVFPDDPGSVIELNRLWVSDDMPRNSESWFVSRCLSAMPPRVVVSYADTAAGHVGYVYRALSWRYAGWTDMDRKTPRFDYISPGKHSRDAFRSGYTEKVRRKPKHRFWTVTGTRRDKRRLARGVCWPVYKYDHAQKLKKEELKGESTK